MHVLVMGVSGFFGRSVAAALIGSGHQVRGVSRRDLSTNSSADSSRGQIIPNLSWVQADLIAPSKSLVPILQDIDVVGHLAAARTGDFEAQQASTVVATERLWAAMILANVARLVSISSSSVCDYQAMTVGHVLNETSSLEADPGQRSPYTQMKLSQEKLVRGFKSAGGQIIILRLGMIYDSEHLFSAFFATCLPGNFWVRIGRSAQLPMTYAGDCAEVICKSISHSKAAGQVFNIVDDDLPNQATYASLFAAAQGKRMLTFIIPWRLICFLSSAVWRCHRWLSLLMKLPGLLVLASLHARCKPLQYSNDNVKQVLDWSPTYDLARAIAILHSFAGGISVVLMEAMAMGVSAVATQMPVSVNSLNLEKNGYLVPPGNSIALSAAVEQLMNGVPLRENLGEAGRQKVEQHFDIANSLTELKTWLTS